MANYYMLGGDGKEYGPVAAEQLRQWMAEGRANGQTQVRTMEGGYIALATVPELNGAAASPASPAPAAPAAAFAYSPGVSDYFMRGGDGKEYGPVSAQQLRQWAAEGRANAQTLVRAANGGPFMALGMVPDLTAARPAAASLPLAQGSALGESDAGMQVKRLASIVAAGSAWMRALSVLMFLLTFVLCLTVIGFVIAWLPLWQGITMWSAATRAQQAVYTGAEQDLSLALEKIRQSFRIGVLLVIALVLFYFLMSAISVMMMGSIPGMNNLH
jgi:hypothetical protein